MSLLKLEHLLRFGFTVSATAAYLEDFFFPDQQCLGAYTTPCIAGPLLCALRQIRIRVFGSDFGLLELGGASFGTLLADLMSRFPFGARVLALQHDLHGTTSAVTGWDLDEGSDETWVSLQSLGA